MGNGQMPLQFFSSKEFNPHPSAVQICEVRMLLITHIAVLFLWLTRKSLHETYFGHLIRATTQEK